MQLKSILNRVQKHPSFVYETVRLVEHPQLSIEVRVRPRAGTRATCSQCRRRAPGYDTQAVRRFDFVPLWHIPVVFLYAVRIPVKPITRSGGKPITCSGANRSPVPTQTDHLSERSDAGRNHESRFSVRVDGRLRFRIESPFRSSLYALCTRRSRIALASVGSPMTSCHLRLPPISRTG